VSSSDNNSLSPSTANIEFSNGNSFAVNSFVVNSARVTNSICTEQAKNCQPKPARSSSVIGPRSRVLLH